MFEKLELTRMAQALSAHSGARLGVIAQNVAQADTPGYRAKDLPAFAEIYRDASAQGALRATRPGHLTGPMAGPDRPAPRAGSGAAPNGNSVSVEREMVHAAEIRRDHDMALAVYRATSDILRASLGRAR